MLIRRAAHSKPGRKVAGGVRKALDEGAGGAESAGDLDVDSWLTHFHGERLAELDAACAGAGPDAYRLFRDLDEDLWALLLSRQYSSYPNILALLPEIPDPGLQRRWNGASGLELLTQSKAFYRHVRGQFDRHSDLGLEDATVLDFGLGWGRLTRFFARDVAPGALLGCDPVEEILATCRATRVPATLARSEFVPERLPFEQGIDLAFSFSVFTHMSEAASDACLRAIHASLNPGGLLIVTVRPPAYLDLDPKMAAARDTLGSDSVTALEEPRFVFAPHGSDPSHPQYEGGEMTYGDTVISVPYIHERWTQCFDVLDAKLVPEDIYQVPITLRRRG